MSHAQIEWKPVYWVYAAAPGLVAFAFEAAQIAAFEATRAPNFSVAGHVLLMFVFFLAFAAVPRVAWSVVQSVDSASLRLVRLGIVGGVLSILHLFLLALILRILHSPPGWGVAHLAHSFLEVWLGNAGVWFLVYAASCGAVLTAVTRTGLPPERLLIRHGDRELSLKFADILWLEAAGNYVDVHTEKATYSVRKPLSELERELRPAGFLRSHRRSLVNAAAVTAIRNRPGETPVVELLNGQTAPLSRRRLAEVREQIASPRREAQPSTPFP